MHWQIVETAEQLTRRYVANRSHCVATLIRLTVWEEPNKRTQCYLASYSGLGGNTTPEYWIDGRRIRAARKALQRKRPCRSRALPVDLSFFVS